MSEDENRKFLRYKSSRIFLIFGMFLIFVFLGAKIFFTGEKARAATAPAVITYQGKLLVSNSAATTTQAMYFLLYDAASGGNMLYAASGTLASPLHTSTTPSNGLFTINLGDTTVPTNVIDPSVFQNNSGVYLEVRIGSQTLTPRKQITAAPFAFNAMYLNGVAATSTASSSTYIPISDATGGFTFNTTTVATSTISYGTITSAVIPSSTLTTSTITYGNIASAVIASSTITSSTLATANILNLFGLTQATLASTTISGNLLLVTANNASMQNVSSTNLTSAGYLNVAGQTTFTTASGTALTASSYVSTTNLTASGALTVGTNSYFSAMTNGSVLFTGASGLLTQDNTNFYWDDSLNRLGIGDNTPLYALTVGTGDLFGVMSSGDVSTSGSIRAYGNVTSTGIIYAQGGFISSASSTIAANLYMSGHIIPNSSNIYDYGSLGVAWRNIYASSSVNVGAGAASTTLAGNYLALTEGTNIAVLTGSSFELGQRTNYNQGIFSVDTNGNASASGTLHIYGATTIGSTLDVSGTATFTTTTAATSTITYGTIASAVITSSTIASTTITTANITNLFGLTQATLASTTISGDLLLITANRASTQNVSSTNITASGYLNVAGQSTLTNVSSTNITASGWANIAGQLTFTTASGTALTASSYVSTTDLTASGALTVGGNSYFSAMTNGSVLFTGSSGLLTQDNTNFYWDNAQKRLGIGDATPLYALTVGTGDLFGVMSSGDVSTSGSIRAYGNVTSTGIIYAQGGFISSASSTIAANLYMSGHIIPNSSNIYDYGSLGVAWRNIYASSSVNVGAAAASTTLAGNYLALTEGTNIAVLTGSSFVLGQKTNYNQGIFSVDTNGNASASGTLHIYGATTIGSTLDVSGTATFTTTTAATSTITYGTITSAVITSSTISSTTITTANITNLFGLTQATLASTTITGDLLLITANRVSTQNVSSTNISASGYLNVTGQSTLTNVSSTNISASGYANITGQTTFTTASGTALTASSYVSTTNLTAGGALTVGGSSYFSTMTNGSILFTGASGLLTQDNTNFYWDNSQKRLGIGDNTPLYALTVGTGDLFGVMSTGDVSTSGSLKTFGNVTSTGIIYAQGGLISSASSTIAANLYMSGHIIPNSSNIYDYGSLGVAWRNIYASSSVNVGAGAASTTLAGNYLALTEGTNIAVLTGSSFVLGQKTNYNQGIFSVDATGNASASGTLYVYGATTLASTLNVSGTATFTTTTAVTSTITYGTIASAVITSSTIASTTITTANIANLFGLTQATLASTTITGDLLIITANRASTQNVSSTNITASGYLNVTGQTTFTTASGTALTASSYVSTTNLTASGALTVGTNSYFSAMSNGSVLFTGASGLLTQDNTNFYWDDSLNRLGIGDNTPLYALTVGTGDLFGVMSTGDVSTSGSIRAFGNVTSTGIIYAQGGMISSASSTFSAGVHISGNLGIGTSTPQAKLHLTGGNFLLSASNPTEKGTIIRTQIDGNQLNGAQSVFVSGKYAYVIGIEDNSLSIIDISNPASSTAVGYIQDGVGATQMAGAQSVFVSGKYAYVVSITDNALSIIDISNPSSPVEIGTIKDGVGATQLAGPYGVYVSGKYAYVAAYTDNALSVIDISNPSSPVEIGTIKDGVGATQLAGAISVYVSGKYAYIVSATDNALSIIDISNPASPVEVGTIVDGVGATQLSGAGAVYISGKYAYIVSATDNALSIIDISNPASPKEVSTIVDNFSGGVATQLRGARSVFVSGKYAYVVSRTENSLSVIDISNPASPTEVGTIVDNFSGGSATQLRDPIGIFVSGKYAYTASDDDDALSIFDISGIEAPSANIGAIESGNLSVTENVNIGNNLYVSNGLNVGMGGIYTDGILSVSGTSTLSDLIIGKGSGRNLGYLYVDSLNGNVSTSGSLKIYGNVTSTGIIYAQGGLISSASSTFASNLQITGALRASSTFLVGGTAGTQDYFYVNGNTVTIGGATASASSSLMVYGQVTTTGHIYPLFNNLYDIGAFGNAWRDIYASGTIRVGTGSILDATSLTTGIASGYTSGTFYVNSAGNISASGTLNLRNTAVTSTIAGGLTIDGTGFVYDYQTNRVGIGTAASERMLDVIGSAQTARLGLSSTDSSAAQTTISASNYLQIGGREYGTNSYRLISFGYYNASQKAPAYIGYQETNTDVATMGDLIFGTRPTATYIDPTERMRITTSGNVGIGTASPGQKLTVSGGAFAITDNTATSTLGSNFFSIASSTSAMQGVFYVDASGNVSASGSIEIVGNVTSTGIIYAQGGLISSASSTFASNLQITGALRASSTFLVGGTAGTQDYFYVNGNTVTIGGATASASSSLMVYGQVTTTGHIYPLHNNLYDMGAFGNAWRDIYASGTIRVGTGSILDATSLTTGIASGYTSGTFYVNSAGNISASGTLNLSNTTLAVVSSTAATLRLAADGSNNLQIWTNGAQRAVFDSSGNFGINTTTPYTALSIAGVMAVSSTVSTATSTINGNFDVGSGAIVYDYTNELVSIPGLEIGGLYFPDDSGLVSWADMGITSGSASGDSEGYVAQVGGKTILTVSGLSDGSSTVTSPGVIVGDNVSGAVSTTLAVYGSVTTTGFIRPEHNNAYDIGAYGYAWKDIYASGTIRVGTGSILDATSLTTGIASGYTSGTFYVNSAGNISASGTLNLPNTAVTSTIAGGLTIDGTGFVYDYQTNRVGIGTASPGAALDVTVAGTGQAWFTNTTAPSASQGAGMIGYTYNLPTDTGQRLGFLLFGSRNAGASTLNSTGISGYTEGAWTAAVSQPSYLIFETTPSGSATRAERMRITSSGNIGIGTASPGQKLTVSGGALAITDGTTTSTLGSNFFSIASSTSAQQGVFYVDSSGNVSASGTLNVATNAVIGTPSGGSTLQVYGGLYVKGSIFPFNVNNATDLGSFGGAFRDIYASGTIRVGTSTILDGSSLTIGTGAGYTSGTLYINSAGDISASGSLKVFGNVTSSGHIYPVSNSTVDIGAYGYAFRDIYASGTLRIGGTSILDGTSLTVGTASGYASGTLYINSAGNVTASGSLKVFGNVTSSGHIYPVSNNSVDIGAYGTAFRNIYASGTTRLGETNIANGTLLVDTPSNPILIGNYASTSIVGVAVSGKYAYVGGGTEANPVALIVLDVSSSTPVYKSQLWLNEGNSIIRSIRVAGKYVYAATDEYLYIIDVSNPTSPTVKGTVAADAYGVAISGQYAYVASGIGNLKVVDLSNPASPRTVGTYDPDNDGTLGVYVSGKYAYLVRDMTSSNDELVAIDISDPKNPTKVSSSAILGNVTGGIYVSGAYAYIADGTIGLRIANISDPANMTSSSIYNPGGTTQDVYVSGKYAYLAADTAGMHVIDVSDPTAPFDVGNHDPDANQAWNVHIAGKYAYVADDDGGLRVIDVKGADIHAAKIANIESSALSVTESVDIGNNLSIRNGLNVGTGGIMSDGVLGVAGTSTLSSLIIGKGSGRDLGRFYVDSATGNVSASSTFVLTNTTLSVVSSTVSDLRLSADASGKMMQFWTAGSEKMRIDSSGNVGVGTSTPLARMHLTGGNFLFSASNPTEESTIIRTQIDGSQLNGAYGVYVSGKYAYVASYTDGSLSVIDISNPASSTAVGNIKDAVGATRLNGAQSVFVSGKYAYVAAALDNALSIIDISNPASPTEVGTIVDAVGASQLGGARSVFVSGKYAYVAASGDDALSIIDISNPASPTEVGTIVDAVGATQLNGAYGVYVSGKYAYVASKDDSSLSIIDISNPASPTEVGTIVDAVGASQIGGAQSVFVSGKYAYVASYTDGSLSVIDVSNPASPREVGTIVDGAGATQLAGALSVNVSGKYAYVTAWTDNSLSVIDISNPASPLEVGTIVDGVGATQLAGAQSVYVSGKYAYVAAETNDSLSIIDISGIDAPSANIGAIESSNLTITENADIGNSLYIRNGLNVGAGGIMTDGILAADTSTLRYLIVGKGSGLNVGKFYVDGTTGDVAASGTIQAVGASGAYSSLTNNGLIVAASAAGWGGMFAVDNTGNIFSSSSLMIGKASGFNQGKFYADSLGNVSASGTIRGNALYVTSTGATAVTFGGSTGGLTLKLVGLAEGGSSKQFVCIDASTGQVIRGTSCSASSRRYKMNINDLTDEFSKILLVRPVSFDWIFDGSHDLGYIAEEFDEIGLTELVRYNNEGLPESIQYEKISLYAIEILKQHQHDLNNINSVLTVDNENNYLIFGSSTVPYDIRTAGTITLLDIGLGSNKISFATSSLFESSVGGFDGANAFVFNAINFSSSSASQKLLSLRSNNESVFSVSANGDVNTIGDMHAKSIVVGQPGQPGDLAERVDIAVDDSVEAGDVLMVDPDKPDTYRRSNGSYVESVAGIVSTNPTIVVGNGKTEYTAVIAMVGRVPVKVSAENGAIRRGDLLVTASTTGYAMKYDSSKESGVKMVGVIGVALDSLESGQGKIMALIRTGWVYNRNESMAGLKQQMTELASLVGANTSGNSASLNVGGGGGQLTYTGEDVNVSGSSILNVASVAGKDNKWLINADGQFITRIDTADGQKEMYAMQSPSSEFVFSSSSQLMAGEARIVFDNATKDIIDFAKSLKINVTLTSGDANGIYVSAKTEDGFIVKELKDGVSSSTFDWMVVAQRKYGAAVEQAVVPVEEITTSSDAVADSGQPAGEPTIPPIEQPVPPVDGQPTATSTDSATTDNPPSELPAETVPAPQPPATAADDTSDNPLTAAAAPEQPATPADETTSQP